jgi:large repetitive protein
VRTVVFAAALAVALAAGAQAFAGDVLGRVADAQGHPISGVPVRIQDSTGNTVGMGVSDVNGNYAIHGVAPGTYTLNSKGQSAVTYVGSQGVSVNWGTSGIAPPMALAQPKTATQTSVGAHSGSSLSVQNAGGTSTRTFSDQRR